MCPIIFVHSVLGCESKKEFIRLPRGDNLSSEFVDGL